MDINLEPQPLQSAGSCLILQEFPAASLENVADGNEMYLMDMRNLLEYEYHFQESGQFFTSLCWKDNFSKTLVFQNLQKYLPSSYLQ